MQKIQSNIELFHLLFLRQLEGALDKKLYSLKGGCNLRFFFKSIRYSEDIDFDVKIISKTTLENKINKLLDSISFRKILQSKGIHILQTNPSKQTETTQRWKILLSHASSAIPIPTKIEFSRRGVDSGVEYGAIDSDVLNCYDLYPIMCNHYVCDAAFLQKISALINRTETQARDIFDLKLLLDKKPALQLSEFSPEQLDQAIQNIHQISYKEFKGHVVAFLLEEYQSFYDSEERWKDICRVVIAALKQSQLERS